MRSTRARLLAIGICAAALAGTGCGSSPQSSSGGGTGGAGDGSAGTSFGGSGTGGSGGSGATGGSSGTGGTGALGGSGGTGALGGSGGAGAGGVGGTSTGGVGGVGGMAGSGGTSTGGAGGTAGMGGSGGTAGTAGSGGTAGTAGSAGADAGSDAATDAGDAGDAAPQCQTNTDCDDGVYCDGVETCDVNGMCHPGTPVVCQDDGFSCTKEFCDESTKSCQTVIQDSVCQDGLFCDGTEQCNPSAGGADPTTGCVAGTAVNCDDGLSCTVDTCDDTNDKCVHTPHDTICDDGKYCDGVETCDPANGAAGTGCVVGTAVNCEDGLACTTDTCNEQTDSCDHPPDNGKCDDGVYCNGTETCDPAVGCKPGTAVSCQHDQYACTVEACDEATKSCKTTLDSSKCPTSGEFCTNLGCQAGTQCSQDSDCDDQNPCNGTEYCDLSTTPGVCRAGTPKNCDDGLPCTYDQCNPTGSPICSHTPIDAYCSDADLCNGDEVCDPTSGCKSGTPLNCDDGVPCTDDSCVSTLGCAHTPDNTICSDGIVCDGTEMCNPGASGADAQGCVSGTPLQCADDGIACTTDVCSEYAGGCTHIPDDSLCGCGQSCSATQGGCGNFCTVSTCQGKVYQCGDCVDNDADCKIDSADPDCIGVCDNNETGFYGDIPGQNKAPCKEDCYFDQDTGAGNDDCYWSHTCDPNEVAPDYNPYGSKCSYNPNKGIPGTSQDCSQLYSAQSALCGSYCGPLVPNGCDCFGCCVIPGAATPVFLGSLDSSGNGSCTLADVGDPTKCKPCEQVPSCLNTCQHCELCVGKTTLPSDCTQQTCPSGLQLCGQPGQAPCQSGYYCVTGCCEPVPQ